MSDQYFILLYEFEVFTLMLSLCGAFTLSLISLLSVGLVHLLSLICVFEGCLIIVFLVGPISVRRLDLISMFKLIWGWLECLRWTLASLYIGSDQWFNKESDQCIHLVGSVF